MKIRSMKDLKRWARRGKAIDLMLKILIPAGLFLLVDAVYLITFGSSVISDLLK